MNPKLASKNPAMQAAWTEATDALMRFKASRDTVDRERALAKLYAVALYEARFLVKRKVDTKLAPDQRRNVDDMAADAAHSILFHERKKDGATGLTVIANMVSADFDPDDGDDLRPLIIAILSNKLMDYVRMAHRGKGARVWIVHRLDRETSGLMVFARTEVAKRALQSNWNQTEKKYLAVVDGLPKEERGTLRSHLDETNPYRVRSTRQSEETREAVTHYVVKRRVAGAGRPAV